MHHKHPLFYRYFRNKELDEFYISVFLKSLAESLITIFVPVYLWTLGFGLAQIATYYLVYYLTAYLLFPTCTRLTIRIGIKKSMALGTTILLVYYFLLNKLQFGTPYLVPALVFGASVSLYYAGFHLEFTKNAHGKDAAEEYAVLRAITIFALILGPLCGSLFIDFASFTKVFFAVLILLAFSILPLLFSKDFTYKKQNVSLKKSLRADTFNRGLAYQANGALMLVGGLLWPLFIYLTLTRIISLGIIVSITSLFMVFYLVWLGKKIDKNKKQSLTYGVFTNAPIWILRLLLLSPIGLFISNFLANVTGATIDLSINKYVYEEAKKKKNLANYFLFRELHLTIGRVTVLLFVMITNSLLWLFVLSFFLTFAYLFLLRDH